MALNFSHRLEDLVSPIRIGNGEIGSCSDYGRDWGRTQDAVSNDILDLLPSDPFGMDISATFTAITGWLEDLEIDYGGFGVDDIGTNSGDYRLFPGWNFIWNNAMMFQALPRNIWMSDSSYTFGNFASTFSVDTRIGDVSLCNNVGCQTEEPSPVSQSFSSGVGDMRIGDVSLCNNVGCQTEESNSGSQSLSSEIGGAPNGALSFALGYLGVRDLIAAESVCRSLRSTVRGDPLLWMTIHIEPPLNKTITDDILLELSRRAQGNLKCLSLVECQRITDDCLKQVLDSNPRLTKLSVPGCTRMSIESVVNILKAFNCPKTRGIEQLRIAGLYGITKEHLEELIMLLGTNSQMQHNAPKPNYFHRRNLCLPYDDDNRAIDIEMCPKCENVRLVYDCPSQSCENKLLRGEEVCRACRFCISRCFECGDCFSGREYDELFSFDLVCFKCQTTQDTVSGPDESGG